MDYSSHEHKSTKLKCCALYLSSCGAETWSPVNAALPITAKWHRPGFLGPVIVLISEAQTKAKTLNHICPDA